MERRPRPRFAVIFFLAAALFAVPKLLVYADYAASYDDGYYWVWAFDALDDPTRLLAPDYAGRPHPLLIAVLAGLGWLFGPNALPVGVVLLVAHGAAALVLGRLVRRLGLGETGAAIATLSFLLWLGLLSALLGLLALAHHLESHRVSAAVLYVACYLASVAFFEYAVMLPLLGIGLALALPTARRPPRRAVHVVSVAALILVTMILAFGHAGQNYRLGIHAELVSKFVALPVALAQVLLVPHADLAGAGAVVRLMVAGAILVLLALAIHPDWRRSLGAPRALLYGTAWIFVSAAPFMLRPTGTTWHSRYLYLPGVGVAIVLGALFDAVIPALDRRRRGLLGLTAVLALVVNVAAMEHLVRKRQRQWSGIVATERYPAALTLVRALSHPLTPNGAAVAVVGGPLEDAEVAAVCRSYVQTRPVCAQGVDPLAIEVRWDPARGYSVVSSATSSGRR